MTYYEIPRMPRVIKVIITQIKRGAGTPDDPVRSVLQIHSLDGKFLAEEDSLVRED